MQQEISEKYRLKRMYYKIDKLTGKFEPLYINAAYNMVKNVMTGEEYNVGDLFDYGCNDISYDLTQKLCNNHSVVIDHEQASVNYSKCMFVVSRGSNVGYYKSKRWPIEKVLTKAEVAMMVADFENQYTRIASSYNSEI